MPPLFDPLLPASASTLVKWGKLYGAAPALAIAEAAAKAPGPLDRHRRDPARR